MIKIIIIIIKNNNINNNNNNNNNKGFWTNSSYIRRVNQEVDMSVFDYVYKFQVILFFAA